MTINTVLKQIWIQSLSSTFTPRHSPPPFSSASPPTWKYFFCACICVLVFLWKFICSSSSKVGNLLYKKTKKTKWVRLAKKCPRLHVMLLQELLKDWCAVKWIAAFSPYKRSETTRKNFLFYFQYFVNCKPFEQILHVNGAFH